MNKRPIGIFDSGVGGLTVFREIRRVFPFEDIVYFGDTARVPYGPKSARTVIDYSLQNARFLQQCGAKIIIVACNTSSSVAIDHLRDHFDVPILGVIEPGAQAAITATKNDNIGVIGTEGTINSRAYSHAIKKVSAKSKTFSRACPLFVALVEEGWENHEVATIIASEYLSPLIAKDIDTLVLGCTHYPILKDTLSSILGDSVKLIDSAEAIVQKLSYILPTPETKGVGLNTFYVSDNEDKFFRMASRLLSGNIDSLQRVSLGESWYI